MSQDKNYEKVIKSAAAKNLIQELNKIRLETESAKNTKDLEPLEWEFILEYFSPEPQISPLAYLRRPMSQIKLGDYSRIDEFVSVRTPISTGEHCHIAARTILGGGPKYSIKLGKHVTLASGSCIYTTSDDPVNDPFAVYHYPLNLIVQEGLEGNVVLHNFAGIALNSVVLPNVTLKEGAFVTPLSQVKSGSVLEKWTMYGGVGSNFRIIGRRNEELIKRKAHLIERQKEIILKIKKLIQSHE